MKLRLQYLIDSLVGRPLVAALNLIAFPLGKILRRDHNLETAKVIVVCKLVGLGSIVQITPLITALRGGFPDARVVFLTRRQNRDYCDLIEEIDETLIIDDGSLFRLMGTITRTLMRMWATRIDLFVNLEVYANLSALLAITSCARNRLGYYMVPRDMRAWGIYTHIVYFNRNAPIHEVYLQAARCLGVDVLGSKLLRPRIATVSDLSLRDRLAARGVGDTPYLLINPNSSELSAERRWPTRYFAEAIIKLHACQPDLQFLVIGGRGEETVGAEVIGQVAGQSGIRITDLTGHLSLGELAELLRDARAFLTNDSGPMHLAFSLSVPTVALFGPVSPQHYGGADEPSRILLYRHLYCSPCVHHFLNAPCGGDNQCMKLISPDEAVAAVNSLLSGNSIDDPEQALCYTDRDIAFGTHSRKHAPDPP